MGVVGWNRVALPPGAGKNRVICDKSHAAETLRGSALRGLCWGMSSGVRNYIEEEKQQNEKAIDCCIGIYGAASQSEYGE